MSSGRTVPASVVDAATEQVVGSDTVRPLGDSVEVWTDHACDEWLAEGHRRTLVRYAGSEYLVAEHRREGRRHVYRLDPHAANSLARPANVVTYDAEYVQQRDLQRRAQRVADLGSPALTLALAVTSPLLGLLPSHVKLWLHAHLGVHVTTATMRSLYLETFTLVLAMLFFAVDLWSGGQIPVADSARWVLLVVAMLVIPDFIVRTGRLVHGSLHQYGFFEWVFRRLDQP